MGAFDSGAKDWWLGKNSFLGWLTGAEQKEKNKEISGQLKKQNDLINNYLGKQTASSQGYKKAITGIYEQFKTDPTSLVNSVLGQEAENQRAKLKTSFDEMARQQLLSVQGRGLQNTNIINQNLNKIKQAESKAELDLEAMLQNTALSKSLGQEAQKYGADKDLISGLLNTYNLQSQNIGQNMNYLDQMGKSGYQQLKGETKDWMGILAGLNFGGR